MSFWSGFAGGMGNGLMSGAGQMGGLKRQMTQSTGMPAQLPSMPFPVPGQDVPFQNEMQVPYGPQQQQQAGAIQNLLRILGGLGG